MAIEIFIILTKVDSGIAEALRTSINEVFETAINVHFFTSKELDGGIRHGDDWFKRILDLLQKCDFAYVLITPSSVDKQWILWESGFIYGVEMANGKIEQRRIRPIIYQLEANQIPSPIRDSHVQCMWFLCVMLSGPGLSRQQIILFCQDITFSLLLFSFSTLSNILTTTSEPIISTPVSCRSPRTLKQ